METLRYAYTPNPWTFAFCSLIFVGCGVFAAKVAHENDRGLILDSTIRLDPGGASIFYWCLAAMSLGLLVLCALGALRAFNTVQEIVLSHDAITVPKRWGGDTVVTLPLTAITALETTQVHSEQFLVVRHVEGKLTIIRSMLPSHDDFDALVDALRARCPVVQSD